MNSNIIDFNPEGAPMMSLFPEKLYYLRIGARLRELRTNAGMTISAAAAQLGVHYNTLAAWETCRPAPGPKGRAQAPSDVRTIPVHHLSRIAMLYQVAIEDIIPPFPTQDECRRATASAIIASRDSMRIARRPSTAATEQG
jgi:transcriptional regulator with XRE-family HTH domain